MVKNGCCDTKNKSGEMKGGNKMEINRNTLMWIIIGILILVVIFFMFKTSSLVTGKVNAGQIDTTGWTANEKMNYEMHGIIPTRVQGSAPSTSAGAGMGGGC